MFCAACGAKCELVVHHFFQGVYTNPVRKWTILAPQYFKANKTFTECVEGYCSPACSLKKYGERNETVQI